MSAQQDRTRPRKIRFRVLIIGRANAGKTSILQRVCDTTESPEIHRLGPSGTRALVQLDPTTERGLHNINDELIFSNHNGYVFHDSRGFEAGGEDELKIVQDFVIEKSRKKRLKDRLHVIWYCIPTDGYRPSLDLQYLNNVCPDNNVPVIALFTKFDQFRWNIRMDLEDEDDPSGKDLKTEVEATFNEHYLEGFDKRPPFLRLENMHEQGGCTDLVDMTANELDDDAVALMLVAVQRDNLELSMKQAIRRTYVKFEQGIVSTEVVLKMCIMSFPSLWLASFSDDLGDDFDDFSDLDFDFDDDFGCDKDFDDFFAKFSFSFTDKAGDCGRDDCHCASFTADDKAKFKAKYDPLKTLLFKLKSFIAEPPVSVSSDDTHHTVIAAVLILECASLLWVSPSAPTDHESVDNACSLYVSSDTHTAVKEQFVLSPSQYSIRDLTEFVLSHRLG